MTGYKSDIENVALLDVQMKSADGLIIRRHIQTANKKKWPRLKNFVRKNENECISKMKKKKT